MTSRTQLDGFIERFAPEIAALAKAALATMRKRFPSAYQLVYDNYNALAIGLLVGGGANPCLAYGCLA